MSETIVKQEKWKDRTNRVLLYYAPGRSRPYTKSAGTADEREAERKAGEWAADISAGRWSPGKRKSGKVELAAGMSWHELAGLPGSLRPHLPREAGPAATGHDAAAPNGPRSLRADRSTDKPC